MTDQCEGTITPENEESPLKVNTTNPTKCQECPDTDCPLKEGLAEDTAGPSESEPQPDRPERVPEGLAVRLAWAEKIKPRVEELLNSGEVRGLTVFIVRPQGCYEIGYIDPNDRRKLINREALNNAFDEFDKMIPTPDDLGAMITKTGEEIVDLLRKIKNL